MKNKLTKIMLTIMTLCLALTFLTIPAFANKDTSMFTLSTMENDMNSYEVYQLVVETVAEEGYPVFTWGLNGIGNEDDSNKVSNEIIEIISCCGDVEEAKNYFDKTSKPVGIVSNSNSIAVPSGYYLIHFSEDFWKCLEITGDYVIIFEAEQEEKESITFSPETTEETVSEQNIEDEEIENNEETSSEQESPVVDNTKASIVSKKIKTSDGKFSDAIEAGVGDEIEFELTGTLPNDFELYQNYYYKIEEILPDGLTYVEDSVRIVSSVVFQNGQDFNASCVDNILTIEIPDLRNVIGINSNSTIVITYKATLNENLTTGIDGVNKSSSKLYFTDMGLMTTYEEFYAVANDLMEVPVNVSEEIETTNIYSYQFVVNSVNEDGETVSNAGFTLEKKDINDEWVFVGEEVNGSGEDENLFTWNGIGIGEYRLTETTVPYGYSGIALVEFEVRSEIGEDGKLMGLEAEVLNGSAMYDVFTDVNSGVIMAKVKEIEVPTWNEMKGVDIVKMILGIVGFK